MEKIRSVITYKEFFEDFLDTQPSKVREKILQTLRIIEELTIVPQNYLKHIEGTDGLYEISGFAEDGSISPKIFADVYIDDKILNSNIDWLDI